MTIELSISRWVGWAPNVETPEQWQEWANDGRIIEPEGAPLCQFLPPIQRRRFSRLGKMALQVADQCLGEETVDRIIFCSRHGEPGRTDKMLGSIIAEGEVSPTQFSLSVHNTFVGLFSIQRKDITPATALAAGKDTFFTGLVDAASLLQTHRAGRILFVAYDEPLPEKYQAFRDEEEFPFALALLLEQPEQAGSATELAFDAANGAKAAMGEAAPLQFLRSIIQGQGKGEYCSGRLVWRWAQSEAA